mmetsp:Transcript_51425/g.115879  ORF Transcript_51425/g.115879 Transcript_51425/m.115879 type:complete len:335 (-) Transcript_51425:18-1022(-)
MADEAEQMEIIETMANHLDMISEAMKEPPEGDSQKALVQELLSDCNETRAKLESLAVQVIEQENREDTFNRITQELDRHDRLQEKFRTWSSLAPGGAVPPSPAVSGMHHMTDGSMQGFDPEGMSSAQSYGDDGARRKKEKKEKKRAKAASDFGGDGGFGGGDGGFGGWPPAEAGDAPPAAEWGAAPAGDAWGAPHASAGGDAGGFGDFGDAFGPQSARKNSTGPASDHGGGWGGFPPPPPPASEGWGGAHHPPADSQATFGADAHSGFGAPPAHSPGPSHHSAPGAHNSSIVFHQPYSDISHDVDHFKMQFVRATAESLGIPAHRIRVKGIRPA